MCGRGAVLCCFHKRGLVAGCLDLYASAASVNSVEDAEEAEGYTYGGVWPRYFVSIWFYHPCSGSWCDSMLTG